MTTPSISRRTQGLGTENAFEVLAEVNKLKREGKDVVSFCIGQPDFGTPNHIREAAIEAIKAGKSGYTDSAGILEAREAVARYFSRTRGIEVKAQDVVIANGAKPFIGYAIACATDPGIGDEVICPVPGYPIYQSQVVAHGATAVGLPLSEEKKFSFDLDDLRARISPRTRLLILNTPHNPTGGVIGRSDLEEIGALAKKHDFWIYADEVYSQIIYDGKFESIASVEGMYERTILSDGASKSYAMPGWRLGFAANPSLAPHLARWVTNTESCANHMTQHAIIRALDGPHDDTHAMVAEFKRRRDVMVRLLNEMDGVSCQMPAGAFYAYPNMNGALKKLNLRSAEQLRQMLLKEGVAVLADHHFGRREPGEKNHYIRLSYCTSMENIEKGLARMKGVLGAK